MKRIDLVVMAMIGEFVEEVTPLILDFVVGLSADAVLFRIPHINRIKPIHGAKAKDCFSTCV